MIGQSVMKVSECWSCFLEKFIKHQDWSGEKIVNLVDVEEMNATKLVSVFRCENRQGGRERALQSL